MRDILKYKSTPRYIAGYAVREFPEWLVISHIPLGEAEAFHFVEFHTKEVRKLLGEKGTAVHTVLVNLLQGIVNDRGIDELLEWAGEMAREGAVTITEVSLEELFQTLCVSGTVSVDVFNRHFGELEPEHHHHDMVMEFPIGISDTERNRLLEMLEVLYGKLERHGLADLYRGVLVFSSTMRDNGLYYPDIGTLKISTKITNSTIMVNDILHEFGHKFYFEDLTARDRSALKEVFDDLMDQDPVVNDALQAGVEVGSRVLYHGRSAVLRAAGSEFTVGRWDGDTVSLIPASGPFTHKGKEYRGLSLSYRDFLTGNWSIDDRGQWREMSLPKVMDEWLPSEYSTKNHEEWWAELFAHYMMDTLTGEVAEWMKGVLTTRHVGEM